jgi:hypothetical protein
MKRRIIYMVIATVILIGTLSQNLIKCDIGEDVVFRNNLITRHEDLSFKSKTMNQISINTDLNQKLNQLVSLIINRHAKKPFKWNKRREDRVNFAITKRSTDYILKKKIANQKPIKAANDLRYRRNKKKLPFKWGR